MTGTPASPPARPILEAPRLDGVGTRLTATIGVHAIVDFFSFVIIPLMPLLKSNLGMSPAQVAILLAVGSLTSGSIQPAVALLTDRYDTRWFGIFGFLVAVVCVSSIGHAETYTQLLILQMLGTAGVGAFHPVAAAAAGHLAGRRRTLGVAAFFMAGMFGGLAGNVTAPMYVSVFGIEQLSFLMIPGLVGVGLLAWAIRAVPHRHHGAADHHRSLSHEERRRRWGTVGILYGCNVLRFIVNMALIFLFIAWIERYTLNRAGTTEMTESLAVKASAGNGPMQAAMQLGMGAFGLLVGAVLPLRHEKLALIVVPVVGSAAIVAFPFSERIAAESGVPTFALAFVLAVVSGIAFGGLIPVTMAVAQRMLPHRTSLASGLMLGGAWSLGGVGPIAAERVMGRFGLEAAFAVTAAVLVLSSILSLALPRQTMLESA